MTKKKKKTNKKVVSQAQVATPAAKIPSGHKRNYVAIIVVSLAIATAGILFFFKGHLTSGLKSAGSYKDYNVLLITLDTLRADHLPMYGYRDVKTPNLDRLASDSFVFEDAVSHVPLTLPSHTSMLTGRLPIGHGVRDNAGFILDPGETTLAEVLKGMGYATGAFVSAFVLDSRWQLNQGFDMYYDNFNIAQFQDVNPGDIQRRAEDTEIEAGHWLDANKDHKFFAWVHYYDPHDPYDPPEPYNSEYQGRPYDGEIAYTDEYIGKLLNKLSELKLSDKTIILVAADHGESLGEHNEATHAMFVYNTTQHVPLLIHVPGSSGNRVKGTVRLIDLMPTVLELLGVKEPSSVQGKSLYSMMKGKEDLRRTAYSESIYAELHYGWSPLESITTQQYKYIQAPDAELYDRINDPGETKNLIKEKSSIAKVLKDQLQEIISTSSRKNLSGPVKMDPETEEKLRALGYIGNTAIATEESRKIDPKSKIHLARGIHEAFDAVRKHEYRFALEKITPVLQEDPSMIDGHFCAGATYIGLNELDKGIDELLKTLALRHDHTMALYNLGYAYELKKNLVEAKGWYEKVLNFEPNHLFSTLKLAHIHRMLNEPDKARPYYLTALKSYQEALEATKGEKAKSALLSTLGEINFGAGEILPAERNFEEAIKMNPQREDLHYNLAQIYEVKGDIPSAVEAYKKEIEVAPKNLKAYNNLGLIYKNTSRLNEAAMCFQKVVELDPEEPRGYILLASTYERLGRTSDAGKIIQEARQRGIRVNR
ncbi:sulfatase-like hydrolase/transferase [bacterium]|nr:sulfatase-like hydrolase/transferase [bacterium]